jgi:hypothetical protein
LKGELGTIPIKVSDIARCGSAGDDPNLIVSFQVDWIDISDFQEPVN